MAESILEHPLCNITESFIGICPRARATRYFEDNGITFPRNFIKNLNGKGAGEAISDEHVPSNEELASLVEFMPIQAKTLTMVLASSGMRSGEAMQLRLDDLDLDRNPARIKIRGEYSKNGKKRITFVSSEALNQLRDWLNYRQQFIEILKERGKHRRKIPLTSDDDRLFPFSTQNFSMIWKKALKKAGLYKTDKVTNRITLHPHNLRKFFRTYGRWTNPDVPEALMGHQSGLVAIYARYDQAEEILEEVYLKAARARVWEDLSSGRVWLSSCEDGVGIGGGVVVGVMRLVVFGWCFRVVSSSLGYSLRDLGGGVVEMGDERSSESLSFAQATLII